MGEIIAVPHKSPASASAIVEAVKGMLDLVCEEECIYAMIEVKLASGDKRSFSVSVK